MVLRSGKSNDTSSISQTLRPKNETDVFNITVRNDIKIKGLEWLDKYSS